MARILVAPARKWEHRITNHESTRMDTNLGKMLRPQTPPAHFLWLFHQTVTQRIENFDCAANDHKDFVIFSFGFPSSFVVIRPMPVLICVHSSRRCGIRGYCLLR
jgi:hypothetical protein